ncbi:hypothetical protein CDAR_616631 [Caerostris darwini]|uniref:Uncharacterized protein n=1 Tax=Caerostris darwini TaxID=1538125 RepID=A0AAV4VUE6_9ARAC|nr:hypothetical protein CDAR_616631 [Caerostris darwini]
MHYAKAGSPISNVPVEGSKRDSGNRMPMVPLGCHRFHYRDLGRAKERIRNIMNSLRPRSQYTWDRIGEPELNWNAEISISVCAVAHLAMGLWTYASGI